jgi:dTDP-4-dehydrorhamnose 3,5-epimerase
MNIDKTELKGVYLIKPTKHEDHRGFFSETYNQSKMGPLKNIHFVQDNQSLSKDKYVFRGLHFQKPPFAQGKLVRVLKGSILDIVVDIRKSSSTFGKHKIFELNEKDWSQIYVPEGFAHGFLTLVENTEVLYKVTNYYSPKDDLGISVMDPDLDLNLPVSKEKIIFSEKDTKQPSLKNSSYYFD